MQDSDFDPEGSDEDDLEAAQQESVTNMVSTIFAGIGET